MDEPLYARASLTRRNFLRVSATVAGAWAGAPALKAADSAPGAKPQGEARLFLEPHLSCPTETSIRITALSHTQPIEAAVEVRQQGGTTWEAGATPLKA